MFVKSVYQVLVLGLAAGTMAQSSSSVSSSSASSASSVSSSSASSASSASSSSASSASSASASSVSSVVSSVVSSIVSSSASSSSALSSSVPSSVSSSSVSSSAVSSSAVSSSSVSSSSVSSSASSSATPVAPPVVGDYHFLGCFSPTNASVAPTLASGDMDAVLCETTCNGSPFFGLFSTQCFCFSDLEVGPQLPDGSCDLPCPGDSSTACGGIGPVTRLRRRQGAAFLISVYELTGAASTTTVTATTTVGELTTTYTATATVPASVNIDINIYFIFIALTAPPNAGDVVYTLVDCSCEGGHAYVLVTDIAAAIAKGLVLYYAQACDVYAVPVTQHVYTAQPCGSCAGGYTFVSSNANAYAYANANAYANGGNAYASAGAYATAGAVAGAGGKPYATYTQNNGAVAPATAAATAAATAQATAGANGSGAGAAAGAGAGAGAAAGGSGPAQVVTAGASKVTQTGLFLLSAAALAFFMNGGRQA